MSRGKKIVGIVLMLAYSASLFSLAIPFAAKDGVFVSPDEHATWAFAQRVAQTGVARIEEVKNEILLGQVHPRSTVTVGSFIVPSGFLGITYIAGVLFFLSPYLALATGPLFCMLGLLALYGVLRAFGSSKEFAYLSTGMLAIHPVWWYYSMRSLMPNVPFVACLLAACWLAVVGVKKEHCSLRSFFFGLSGMMLACALAIRASEWVWIVGLFAAGVCYGVVKYHKEFLGEVVKKKWEIASAIGGFMFVAVSFLFIHTAVYGSPFTTGYTVNQSVWEVGNALAQSTSVSWYEKIFAIFFPFGVHERAIAQNVWRYIVALYPWMTGVGVWGAGWWVWEKRKSSKKMGRGSSSVAWKAMGACLAWGSMSALYLLTLYGSWVFYDNPDPSIISLGNSHTRYWLPFFVLLAPATAYAILRMKTMFLSWAGTGRVRMLVQALPIIGVMVMLTYSTQLVFWGEDGVLRTRTALETFAEKRIKILEETPKDALVIVDRADKYLWPDRAVVVPLRDEKTYQALPTMLEMAPVYYFGITLPEADLVYLRDVIFAQEKIVFIPVLTLQEETLYEIRKE